MHDNSLLFEDELDDEVSGASPALPHLPVGAVLETMRTLGLDGFSSEQLARGGHFAVLNMAPGVKKRQMIYHVSQAPEIISGAEQMRLTDFYVSNAVYASKRSRLIANVKSLNVNWVDLDCYTFGIVPTQEFIEKLIHRAYFFGIPHPSHIISSGRGLYLKWVLDKPIPDSLLPAWHHVQRMLTQIYIDLGADVKAMDAARVLRVVNTLNSKVIADAQRASSGVVGVVWNEGPQRHSFESLWQAANSLDEGMVAVIKKMGAKVAHQAGRALAPDFIYPPGYQKGDLSVLSDMQSPRLRRKGDGKGNGFSAQSLAWCRWLDFRDLAQRRAEASGGTGVPEGSRDLTMLLMVDFLAQAGIVNSRNFYGEVDGLMRAFDGADFPGPRGFENPRKSGALATLLKRVKASEEGHKVRFAGALWDPKYTPSNDYLINLFQITSDEMRGMRTIIDSSEKRRRADQKVEGRAERREVRDSRNKQALRLREEHAAALKNGGAAVPKKKVCAAIAKELNLTPNAVRNLFKRHDDQVALAEDRKLGKAPPRAYRKASELSPDELEARNQGKAKSNIDQIRANGYAGDGSPADLLAWATAKTKEFKQASDRNAAALAEEARQERERGLRKMNATLERIMRQASERAGVPDILDELASEAPQSVVSPAASENGASADPEDDADSILSSESEAIAKTLLRSFSQMRDNPANQAPPTMNPLPSAHPSPDESTAISTAQAGRKTSKRSLLDKARLAQTLQVSANDPVVEPASAARADPKVAALDAPPGVARVAASVIPPDLLESWGGSVPEESEPAGMPDLDDGYLDSFSEGEGAAVSSPPVARAEQAPAPRAPRIHAPPVSGGSSASSRPAPVLAFARGAKPGAPAAPGLSRGFGFNRPAAAPAPARSGQAPTVSPTPPASGPVGFAPVRRVAAVPAQPLGFGGPARLSPDQARANGQQQDFAKLFEEPRYDADGIPLTYPKTDVWPQEDLPAGSRYTREEWANARKADEEFPTGHVVVELQVGNPVTSALIKVPRRAVPESTAPPVARTRVVDGKVVKLEPYQGIDDPLADAIADTIVVSRMSPIAAEVRGAVEGGIEIVRGGVSGYYRFIRPKTHYTDPDKFLYINSKLQMTGSLGEVGARMAAPVEEAPAETVEQEEELETAEAPRG